MDNIFPALHNAARMALSWSENSQAPEGYWIGLLETNCCMEAEWIMAMHFMGIENAPGTDQVVQAILNQQRDDGSWEVYYRAPSGDINTTVECYTALKTAGFSAEHQVMKKARQWILDHGGLTHIRVFTRYWLALMGEWPWNQTPALPPEMIFQPLWFPFNIYHFSSWARATIMPLAVLCSRRPSSPLAPERRLDELFPQGRENFDFRIRRKHGALSWEGMFFMTDRLLNAYTSSPVKPFRETAIKVSLDWIIRHQDADGVWGGIQPPLIYSLMALHTEGFLHDHPVMAKGLDAFDRHWSFEKNGGRYICASESIVWDTFLTMLAQLDCGLDFNKSESMQRALKWVMGKFITSQGDWQVKVRGVEPGAWAFERANTWYPDIDDTAVALIVLVRLMKLPGVLDGDLRDQVDSAVKRALSWIDAMQCSNGGWAAFDRDNYGKLLTKIPFSDFGEALDPPSVDVTGHVLEAMGLIGRKTDHPVVARGLEYIRSEQEEDGSWFGRWGVNYIYGTAAVLPGLESVGEDMNAPYIKKAAEWIAAHQNPDGGWGESCASYMDDTFKGKGESTASQTAWAIMALLAAGDNRYEDSIKRGLNRLITTQRQDGTWDEPWYTGTGFPGYGVGERTDIVRRRELDQGGELSRGFMINYNLYRHYFPLMAIGRALRYYKGYGVPDGA